MQAYAGHIAAKLEQSETGEKRAVVAVYDTHEEAGEAVHEFHRSGFARSLTGFGKIVEIQEAEDQIITPIQPSQLALDICSPRLLCRMAKKLGCHHCAKK